MNIWKIAGPVFFAATMATVILPATAYAQQKTVKACEDEWKADKAGNQAKGVTEKDYVAKCRTAGEASKPAAATPAAAKPVAAAPAAPKSATAAAPAAGKKTVKACEDKWKADKASNQAKGVTEKDYVAKCRGDATTAATPSAAPPTAAPPAAKPAAATPAAAPKPTAPAAPTAATAPTGANQYAAEAQAKGHCPADTIVWANLDSKIFHFAGHKDYGHTKKGAYMCEKDALAQSIRAAKDEKHP